MATDSVTDANGGRSESHAPQPCDIQVRNGFVVTMDEARNVYPAGAVATRSSAGLLVPRRRA